MIELRPYQSAAVQSARLAMAGGKKRIVINSPTGSGKTILAEAVIRGAVAKGKRVVFLCNRIGLVKQASQHLARNGIAHGILQGENTVHVHLPVIVASIQTVARRGMPDCDLIIIDEAHGVAGSREYRQVIFQRNMVPVIGLSATPFAKGMAKPYAELGGNPLFESLVVAATIRELIDAGFLVDCDIYAPSAPDLSSLKTQRNAFGEIDFSDKEAARASDTPALVGDIVSHWLRLAADTPTVCFASNIAHSKHITERFRASGVPAEHIDCYTSEDDRAAIMGRVAAGETMVISNVGILTEGWDFPACKTMILARPTKSLTRYIQMAGRVLRPHESKDRALILDHSGTVETLGFPTDDLPLALDDGAAGAATKKEREAPKPTVCQSCKAVKPPRTPVCPKCGHVAKVPSDVVEHEGELELVSRNKAKKDDKQQVYSELMAIRNARGYADGWVAHKYRAYFGVWPRGLAEASAEPSQEILSWVTSQNIRHAKRREVRHAA